MLKELRIFNIILIESAEIFFEEGLNVITGETGSGKSAIMHALNLITGSRAETSLIRKGKDKGAVEAFFEGKFPDALKRLLEEASIHHEEEEGLIIRREVLKSGKSRALVNHQLVHVSLLKKLGESLLDIVSQHANRHLLSLEAHRHIIDLYGNLDKEALVFTAAWEKQITLQKKLDSLISSESQRLREIENGLRELEEIRDAALREGEDEELFQEYSTLINAEELASKSGILLNTLAGEKNALISQLNRQKSLFEELAVLDPQLKATCEAFTTAALEIEEVAYTLAAYHNRLECNPGYCKKINERLTLISQLKRKYGNTIADIHSYEEKTAKKMAELENCDLEIENIKEELALLIEEGDRLAKELTAKRKEAAQRFEKEMVQQLSALNMPKIEFNVKITSQNRNRTGDDQIEFFFLPNIGENPISIKDCASGGELSRILLAIHVLLAGKGGIPTLVFDEIDEGIGGKTAGLVGEKLKEIGENHQIICITHFAQVAKLAGLHIQISKGEKEGRTSSEIEILDTLKRHQEISRMLGQS